MTYTVNFLAQSILHCNGVYESFEDAKAKAKALVESEADSSWVVVTGEPELRTLTYRKEVPPAAPPPPRETILDELATLDEKYFSPRKKKK